MDFADFYFSWRGQLDLFGLNPEVIAPSRDYLTVLSFSLIPIYFSPRIANIFNACTAHFQR